MMTSMLEVLSAWLTQSVLSSMLRETMWAIPAVQTLHILSIAVAVSSVYLFDLRVIGVFSKNQSTVAVAKRVLPWAWSALGVLAMSGSLLIVAEPERSLMNAVFGVKLMMVVAAAATVWVRQRGLRLSPGYWESTPGVQKAGRAIAVASLVLWTGVVFAGRLIAYVSSA